MRLYHPVYILTLFECIRMIQLSLKRVNLNYKLKFKYYELAILFLILHNNELYDIMVRNQLDLMC